MSRFNDTIAALATPVGTSAVAVIRASGPNTAALVEAVFGVTPLPWRVRHGDYHDLGGALLDDVLFVFYRAPKSYTAEDSFEISCHGNPFIAQKILEDLYARGCRAAEPGEFTQRAFVNGRMDLSQAEAVMDLIHAHSDRALAAANQQLRGALSNRIQLMITGVLRVLARVEAYIDFPDEDLPTEDRSALVRAVDEIVVEARALLATAHYGSLLRDGLRTVILGAPNVGKSSLLNRLVGHDRALVSAEPGTTRDFIEERLVVGPYCLRLIDTAGLNPAPVPLEKAGMEKTMANAKEADLVILVLDASAERISYPANIEQFIKPGRTVLVLNKSDLKADSKPPALPIVVPTVRVSALTGAGMAELTAVVTAAADALRPSTGADLTTINARHANALSIVQLSLCASREKLAANGPSELISSDLRAALSGLEIIRGKIDNEEMLDELFASFCIGK